MKYQLIEAHAIRKPHQGLIVTAYYLPKTEDKTALLTKPHKIVMFNRWPPVEVEADYVEVKLNGVYAYPNGTRTRTIRAFCPKKEDGDYLKGCRPEEVIHYQQNILRRVGD